MAIVPGPFSLERMMAAPEKVKRRLLASTAALEAAGVPYAVVGGNAVAAWVSRVDEGAVRNTRDVDVLINRSDLDRARVALEGAGFVYRHVAGIDVFLDSLDAKASEGVRVVFAGEKVRAHEPAGNPSVEESVPEGNYKVLSLEALVRVKLTAFRRKDQVHLLDLIGVGLLDASWPAKLPAALGERLQTLLDDPEG